MLLSLYVFRNQGHGGEEDPHAEATLQSIGNAFLEEDRPAFLAIRNGRHRRTVQKVKRS